MGEAGTVFILAAGESTRFLSAGPKVLQPVCGRPLLGYVLEQARSLQPRRIVCVVGHQAERVRETFADWQDVEFVTQEERLGTGHALRVAHDACQASHGRIRGPVVVLYGDMPLIRSESLLALLARLSEVRASVLTARVSEPRGFGRVLREASGEFMGIVEEREATAEQLDIDEVNLGVYAFRSEDLAEFLPKLNNQNQKGEYYLTDFLGMLCRRGQRVSAEILEDEREAIGINTLEHLSDARRAIQERILLGHMAGGVFIEDPASTYIDHGVEIGAGTKIFPCTVIRKGVKIGRNCEAGPFTHLRAGTVLEDGVEVGNFTEAKNASVGSGTKAKHLTYLGDVEIGPGTNIGAGTIIANYDGVNKHKTTIGKDAFVGSGSILIAPNSVGDRALTGAGAVLTRNSNVPAGEAWVGVPARSLGKRPPTTEEAKSSGSAKNKPGGIT